METLSRGGGVGAVPHSPSFFPLHRAHTRPSPSPPGQPTSGFDVDIGRGLCGETTLLGAGLLGTKLPAVVHAQIDVSSELGRQHVAATA